MENEREIIPVPMSIQSLVLQAYDKIVEIESIAVNNIQDAAIAGHLKDAIESIKRKAKGAEEVVDNAICKWMDANSIKKADIGGGKVLVKSKVKTNKFDTQAIYKAMDVSQELQDILPANPAFRVSAVRQIEKISHLTWEESKDVVKVSISDGRYLK